MKPIRIALTKGRLEAKSIALFERLGYDCSAIRNKGRKLILPVPGSNLEVVLAKAADVATYVENGVCDLGILGKDTILEAGGTFYEVADLGFGRCRFALAVPQGVDFYAGYHTRCIASKYVHVTKGIFERKNMDVKIVKIEGSVELAPILGLSDGIVDIVETGATLRENGLVVAEYLTEISARLIVNIASLKLRKAEIEPFINQIEHFLAKEGTEGWN
ncbi:MAG TPA: ATP phosphoribosyltransferase [Candidatus Anaerotruncus excrementipullorum]|uniref:ATP phosphoribosyltransferase n=1 Tax=Candidatus Anaerotruncus excrementipullorum TaxID=2838465 RepID=A0A9D1WPU0_9FIRM|nr:ATP phosphoribosyltransferase [Candidatus Anaerotruncus excrementipullorum]